jgi:hypothetical protein
MNPLSYCTLRRTAFNITLFISAFAGLIGAGSPTFVGIATLCAFIGLGTGGNQPVDSAIFLEFIPASHQYLLTMQSWSIGQALAALIGWYVSIRMKLQFVVHYSQVLTLTRPLIVNFSCPSTTPTGKCAYKDNQGWRYCLWTFGGITLLLSFLRFFFRVYETPKYLLGKGKDKAAVEVIQKIAKRNGGTTWLTLEHFERVDRELEERGEHGDHELTANEAIIRRAASKWRMTHIRGLFVTPKMALSTCMIIIIWAAIGMAYPLYNSFIPFYLAQKSVSTGTGSLAITYRNYAIQAICGIPASVIGGYLVELKYVGRKGTGALASILTGVFLFLFTRASSSAGVLGFSCAIAFFQNLVYGLLYSYTPEVFPAPLRGTGNGLVSMFNRLSGLMAPIIVAYSGVTTSLPVWISAGLFIASGIIFLCLPYETRGKASS